MPHRKALLVPINSKRELFLQDRDGHQPPPWGFFGGGIDGEETPLEAVVRESKEELDLDLQPEDLVFMGEKTTNFSGKIVERHFFLYKTDQVEFTVLEGAGGYWLSYDEAAAKLDIDERFEEIVAMIEVHL